MFAARRRPGRKNGNDDDDGGTFAETTKSKPNPSENLENASKFGQIPKNLKIFWPNGHEIEW